MDILIECLDSNSISKYDYYIEIYNIRRQYIWN